MGTTIVQNPNPHLVIYKMEPHIETAFWLILWAIIILLGGWVIDMLSKEMRKNKDRDNHR